MRQVVALSFIAVFAFASTAHAFQQRFGFQTARAQIQQVLTLSVTPALVDFGIFTAGSPDCRINSSTQVGVNSSSTWDLFAFTNLSTNPAGQLRSGTLVMSNPLETRAMGVFQSIAGGAAGFVTLLSNQQPTAGVRQVSVLYRLCSAPTDQANAPNFYTIPVFIELRAGP